MMPFYTPVFRKGLVCNPQGGKRLTYEQATEVGKYLASKKALKQYLESFDLFCANEKIRSAIIKTDETDVIRLRYQLTPIGQFPAYTIELDGREFIARESITVCAGRSDSKLWISLSPLPDDEELDACKWRELYDVFIKYAHVARPLYLLQYYTSIITSLAESGKIELSDSEENCAFELTVRRKFIISSIETMTNIDSLVRDERKYSGEYMLAKARADARYWSVVEPFIQFACGVTGLDDVEGFAHFAANATPMYEGGRRVVPYVHPGRETLRRLAIGLSVTDVSNKDCPIEHYYTVGTKDTEFTERRYRNADLISRAIMNEVGRVY